MVNRILLGQKNMTRRTNGLEELNSNPDNWQFEWADFSLRHPWRFTDKSTVNDSSIKTGSFYQAALKCPYGKPGDILWVRERFMLRPNGQYNFYGQDIGKYVYYAAASKQFKDEWDGYWKPSIHMPKVAARIWIKITRITPQRLHDISPSDIVREGIIIFANKMTEKLLLGLGEENSAISFLPADCLSGEAPKISQRQILRAFWAELWCKINGRQSWDLNPWVWAISFEVLSKTGKPENI